MTWLTVSEFQRQFGEAPPTLETLRQWAAKGAIEMWQPNGPRSRIYVRYTKGTANGTEQQFRDALHAAQKAQRRHRRATA